MKGYDRIPGFEFSLRGWVGVCVGPVADDIIKRSINVHHI